MTASLQYENISKKVSKTNHFKLEQENILWPTSGKVNKTNLLLKIFFLSNDLYITLYKQYATSKTKIKTQHKKIKHTSNKPYYEPIQM